MPTGARPVRPAPKVPTGLIVDARGRAICPWPGADPLYQTYHNEEWGRPVHDDRRLFEKLCLEGFQAGLSWLTILKKRAEFRRAFHDFSLEHVAAMRERDVLRLLQNPGIVRHRGKIVSTINNAQKSLLLTEEFGSLDTYFWQFVPPLAERPRKRTKETLAQLAQTNTSKSLSRDLKRRGFTFVGPVTCYAFMQAMGLVNDHLDGCVVQAECGSVS